MLTLCFVSFYDIKEYILSLKLAFEQHLYKIENYPLYRFAYDQNDKLDNYSVHLVKYLQKIQPDVVFWIFLDVDIDTFRQVRASLPKSTQLVMYLADQTPINESFLAKLKNFDYLVIHHLESVKKIVDYSAMPLERILYLPPCYDNTMFKPGDKPVEKYHSDLVYLNYNYNEQIEQLVRQLVEFSANRKLRFSIYGSSQYRATFPDNYVSSYGYLEQPLITNSAKLVITDDPNQVIRIMGQKRLFAGVGMGMTEYTSLYIGEYHQIDTQKLERLLTNGDQYLKELEAAMEQLTESTYENMATKLHQKMCLDRFDAEFYQKTFYPDVRMVDPSTIKRHYLETGMVDRVFPAKFTVPKQFDDISYKKSLESASTPHYDNPHYLYYHWKRHSNNLAYIRNDEIDLSQIMTHTQMRPNISFNNLCQLFKVFIDFHNDGGDQTQLLVRFAQIVGESPNVDLNSCLKMFFQWKETVCGLYLDK